MLPDLIEATWETCWMVLASGALAMLLGFPIGLILFSGSQKPHSMLGVFSHALGLGVNTLRSFPFAILMVAVLPFTRWVVGTGIGSVAALVPLTLSAAPYWARLVEQSLNALPSDLTEVGHTLGMSSTTTLRHILLPEALPSMVQGMVLMLINLVGYSSMAGMVGAGGLGTLALNYGYQRFDTHVMISTVLVLVVLVSLLQLLGDTLHRWMVCDKR